MNVLLLGSGGREHALALALAGDPKLSSLTIAPGNPGTALLGENADVDPCDAEAVVALARRVEADLVVVGPEAPLVAGVPDALRAAGFAVFGPDAAAARIEGSKAFAKEIMTAAGVPTAEAVACRTLGEARAALERFGAPYVVKQDGLAAGKGVVVTSDFEAALAHAEACVRAAAEGSVALIVEEYLDGPEVSLFCLADGATAVALPAAQDFKRALDGNEGPNTGGMGAYSPLTWAPEGLADEVLQTVALPVIEELARRGTPFIGLLYCGLALTSRGVRVVEFNARFGDPETQVVLPRIESSVLEALTAAAQGRLGELEPLRISPDAAVTVVLAAPGYPAATRTGGALRGLDAAGAEDGVSLVFAGVGGSAEGGYVASGGRVLNVVGRGASVAEARAAAYRGIAKIQLEGGHYRTDIAAGK